MRVIRFTIYALASFALYAETSTDYRIRRATEVSEESASRQENAIRECAVSKIQKCIFPIIAQLKKEGKENAVLRRESANALGRLRAIEAREPLLQMLSKEEDVYAKGAMIGALGLIGNKADVKTLSAYATDKSDYIRRRTARAFYDIDDKDASVQAANLAKQEKDDLIRAELLGAALRHNGANVENISLLTKILYSADRAARMRTAEILGDSKNKEALADLERAMEIELDKDVRIVLRRAIHDTIMGY
ncbi:MAG: hypothetical protein LDLANPLL_02297 [Turneriella sp.]|nr:hypothetical protein [Turneriella sp.]